MADWNELFADDSFALDTPHPLVAEFVASLSAGSRVYDLGCGAGRHLVPLLDAGFTVIAGDISPRGIGRARRRTAEHPRRNALTFCFADMREAPFVDACFDGVLSVNVINHGTWKVMQQTFAEVHRVLKPGGIFRALLVSDRDSRCGQGRRIEERTFVPLDGSEAGIPHHFFNEADLHALADEGGWSERSFTLREKTYEGGQDRAFGILPQAWGRPTSRVFHWDTTLIR